MSSLSCCVSALDNPEANCPTIEEVGDVPNMNKDAKSYTTDSHSESDEVTHDVLWPLKQNPAIPEWLRPLLQTVKKRRVLLELLKEYAPNLSKNKKTKKNGKKPAAREEL